MNSMRTRFGLVTNIFRRFNAFSLSVKPHPSHNQQLTRRFIQSVAARKPENPRKNLSEEARIEQLEYFHSMLCYERNI